MSEDTVAFRIPERRTTTKVQRNNNPSRMQKFEWRLWKRSDPYGIARGTAALGLSVAAALSGRSMLHHGNENSNQVIIQQASASQGDAKDMVAAGAHPQKYQDQAPRVIDTRTKETDAQIRVRLIAEIFPNLSAEKFNEVNGEIDKVAAQMERDGVYGDMKEMIRKYDSYIDRASSQYNIPKAILYGIFATEASGDLSRISEAGAHGPGIMPDAADEMGVSLEKRSDPDYAFRFIAGYLDKYRKIFGNDLGFGIENYFMGPGNMAEMIRVGAFAWNRKDPGELTPENHKKYEETIRGKSVRDFLNEKGVQAQVLSRLDPKTSEYVLRVLAAAEKYSKTAR